MAEKETQVLTRKFRLVILGETKEEIKEDYNFIRNAQYAQYQGLNRYMGLLASAYYNGGMDLNSDLFKEAKKTSQSGELFNKNIEYGTGVNSKALIWMKVNKDFSAAIKNGLAKGERSVTNYKRDFPLMTHGKTLKFSYDEENNIIIKWVHKKQFKVVLGKRKNNAEIMHTLNKVINGEYKVNQSSLYFNKKNHLMINLSITMPITKKEFVEGRTLGVDIGIKYPAYASVSDAPYIRRYFGSAEEFIKVRTQMKKRRERLQQQLANVKGGKGRKKKLKALNSLQGKERNFANTYNHSMSKRIVEFAINNKCEYINLENLTKDGFKDNLLQKWSYYELQSLIEYKAKMNGLKVRYVNPAYTSQKCSECGHIDKDNRQTQEEFVCTKCGHSMNADYNASINIANSTEFEQRGKHKKNKEEKKKDKENEEQMFFELGEIIE